MDPYQTILTLRAVRRFTHQAIPADVTGRILQAARWTGSAKNTQPWQFVVVSERQMLTDLAACGTYASHLAGAALGIIVATPAGVCAVRCRAGDAEHDVGRLDG
jgi:nitroreductase